ncbi:MAG: ankyrin repeat domain-containing protein [Bacillota bacterium]
MTKKIFSLTLILIFLFSTASFADSAEDFDKELYSEIYKDLSSDDLEYMARLGFNSEDISLILYYYSNSGRKLDYDQLRNIARKKDKLEEYSHNFWLPKIIFDDSLISLKRPKRERILPPLDSKDFSRSREYSGGIERVQVSPDYLYSYFNNEKRIEEKIKIKKQEYDYHYSDKNMVEKLNVDYTSNIYSYYYKNKKTGQILEKQARGRKLTREIVYNELSGKKNNDNTDILTYYTADDTVFDDKLHITKIDFNNNESKTRVHFMFINNDGTEGKFYIYKPEGKHAFEMEVLSDSSNKKISLKNVNINKANETDEYYEINYEPFEIFSFSLDFEYIPPISYTIKDIYEKGDNENQNLWSFGMISKETGTDWSKKCYFPYAVLYQDKEFINRVLNENIININEDFRYMPHTPLILAAKHINDLKFINYLLDKGASISNVSNIGVTPLMAAVMNNNLELVKMFYNDYSNINAKTNYGDTAMIYASKYGDIKLINFLIDQGAAVMDKDDDNITALMYASKHNSYEVVKKLIDEDARVNERDSSGRTSIYYAAAYNPDSRVINLLIKNGANVNSKNKKGITPLMCASAFNNYEVVKSLIKNKAEMNSKTESGFTPILYAAKYSNDPEIIDILVENGAEIKGSLFNDVPNPLYQSAKYNSNPEITKKLIELGAYPNDDYDNSPLIEAAENNNAEVVEVLLEAGVDVNYQNSNGNTALHRAAYNAKDPRIIELLLEYGANAVLENKINRKAIEYIEGFEMGFGVVSENKYLKDTDAYWRLNDASY